MIRQTVQHLGSQLERLAGQDIGMTRAFDILSGKARSIEEIVAVEVMREVYLEQCRQRDDEALPPGVYVGAYADSSTRSARMPSMALSR
jgi:hypothetical protein